jgi:hypothetical protein
MFSYVSLPLVPALRFAITCWMNVFASAAEAPMVTLNLAAPALIWNTRRSVLSHDTGPSSSYGFGSWISCTTAPPVAPHTGAAILVTEAEMATLVTPPTAAGKPPVPVKLTL